MMMWCEFNATNSHEELRMETLLHLMSSPDPTSSDRHLFFPSLPNQLSQQEEKKQKKTHMIFTWNVAEFHVNPGKYFW